MQAAISQFESELAALKSRLETQELEMQKANSKFEFSVSENEKLKKNFESERKTWADEKASLVTRAETAEASLAEATTELSNLTSKYPKWSQPSLVSYCDIVLTWQSYNDYCNKYFQLTVMLVHIQAPGVSI